MVDRFDHQQKTANEINDIYGKLHEEIIRYKDSVHDILSEMQPFKEQLIVKITEVIKKTIPNSEVKVYGSHATKLCLPWSDIDLVLIPPKQEGGLNYSAKSVLS